MTESRCRGCGAAIIWAETPAGKSMPLDAAAYTAWAIDAAGATQGSPKTRPVQVRRSHFETCPKADEFRRAKT